MTRRSETVEVKFPGRDEAIAPVTILDAQAQVVSVLPATEFRRIHGPVARSSAGPWPRPGASRRERRSE